MTLLTTKQAAEMLQFSPSYMRKLVMRRKVPFIKIGRSVRFRKEDLEQMLDSNYSKPIS